ncbi:MAG TPA: MarR family winged helix-turn-helix transcriptional regulator [Actinocatenispora sp.]
MPAPLRSQRDGDRAGAGGDPAQSGTARPGPAGRAARRPHRAALDAGLLRRGADPTDGRRSPLRLTAAGRHALDRVHAFRRDVVAEATAGWSAADRVALAGLLTRFVADFTAVTTRA